MSKLRFRLDHPEIATSVAQTILEGIGMKNGNSRLGVTVCTALLLGACTQSTGVLPIGPDTFSITTSDELGGVVAAKRAAIVEASTFCTNRGQQMVAIGSQSSVKNDWAGDSIGHHDFTFRCLNAGDPQLGRPVVGGSQQNLILN